MAFIKANVFDQFGLVVEKDSQHDLLRVGFMGESLIKMGGYYSQLEVIESDGVMRGELDFDERLKLEFEKIRVWAPEKLKNYLHLFLKGLEYSGVPYTAGLLQMEEKERFVVLLGVVLNENGSKVKLYGDIDLSIDLYFVNGNRGDFWQINAELVDAGDFVDKYWCFDGGEEGARVERRVFGRVV